MNNDLTQAVAMQGAVEYRQLVEPLGNSSKRGLASAFFVKPIDNN